MSAAYASPFPRRRDRATLLPAARGHGGPGVCPIVIRARQGYEGRVRMKALMPKAAWLGIVVGLAGLIPHVGAAEDAGPIVYALRFPSPEKHVAEVEATIPTERRPTVELMMAVWSPGFYRVEDYARKVEGVAARTPDGTALEVESTRKNRWRIPTKGRRRSSCRTGSRAIAGRSR